MKNILIVAAHPDDEVLGCGGTIAKLTSAGNKVIVAFLCDGEKSRKGINKKNIKKKIIDRKKAAQKACSILGAEKPFFNDFPDNKLDSLPILKVVQSIENLIDKFSPDTIFTHFAGDLNVDHSIINKAVITACRPQPQSKVKEILFFEIPSSSEWYFSNDAAHFRPNWFEDISDFIEVKLKALECYGKEVKKWPHPRSIKGVEYLARYRGSIVGYSAAEAFILGYKK